MNTTLTVSILADDSNKHEGRSSRRPGLRIITTPNAALRTAAAAGKRKRKDVTFKYSEERTVKGAKVPKVADTMTGPASKRRKTSDSATTGDMSAARTRPTTRVPPPPKLRRSGPRANGDYGSNPRSEGAHNILSGANHFAREEFADLMLLVEAALLAEPIIVVT
ncbi:hypothetical protein C8T65DRAFT_831133 [Cerioporus squamosus]|nr:hypothetical protein C8T65DRAFT_831133 [Cerioporus squamosus]